MSRVCSSGEGVRLVIPGHFPVLQFRPHHRSLHHERAERPHVTGHERKRPASPATSRRSACTLRATAGSKDGFVSHISVVRPFRLANRPRPEPATPLFDGTATAARRPRPDPQRNAPGGRTVPGHPAPRLTPLILKGSTVPKIPGIPGLKAQKKRPPRNWPSPPIAPARHHRRRLDRRAGSCALSRRGSPASRITDRDRR